jgi:hypothetical protein
LRLIRLRRAAKTGLSALTKTLRVFVPLLSLARAQNGRDAVLRLVSFCEAKTHGMYPLWSFALHRETPKNQNAQAFWFGILPARQSAAAGESLETRLEGVVHTRESASGYLHWGFLDYRPL